MQTIFLEAQTGKPIDDGHVDTAHIGGVNAIFGVVMGIKEVQFG
ncbi:hypothetical protein SDC9_149461 [bioreactor metagenome]|uniref:Uncharacterized protein n=1 Tax=bioreactor metagenome TaxID=1076179 RepID=A0A645EKE7_9ZZZZ